MKFSFFSFGFRSRNKVEYKSNEKIDIKMVSQSVSMYLTTEDERNLETTGERTRHMFRYHHIKNLPEVFTRDVRYEKIPVSVYRKKYTGNTGKNIPVIPVYRYFGLVKS